MFWKDEVRTVFHENVKDFFDFFRVLKKLLDDSDLVSGSVPLDPLLSASLEEGRDFAESFPESSTFSAISSISQRLLKSLESD